MNDLQPLPPPGDAPYPPAESLRAGYEVRDLDVSGVVLAFVTLAVFGILLHAVLWGYYRNVVAGAAAPGACPPAQMPGEPSVNDRLASIPPPRLDPLVPLRDQPPTYRPSDPARPNEPPFVRPEDLRADRQPQLRSFGWVDRQKGIAQIPIDLAMQAVSEKSRAKPEERR